jgi:hypothetical protein
MKSLALTLLLSSASAFATPSACVVYLDNSADPVSVQQSCDGADLSDLFKVSGMTAGMSKTIQYFMEKDYTFVSCSDSYSPATQTTAGNAYSRCTFIKK